MFFKSRLTLLLATFLLLPPHALWAEEPVYTVSGTVRDASTSQPLTGVTVILKDTYNGAATGINGNYSIRNIPAGKQVLVFSFLSYVKMEAEVDVRGDVAGFDIVMEEQSTGLEQVTVKARAVKNTEASMVGTVKMSPQVTSGISAAQISKSPDRTASEVVRRVPGITLMDERFIVVRGLSQRYNNAWINGLAVPSTETDSRAFSFDLIPGSQIDNLLVYKSPSPEIPGDFSGGFVKIVTKSVPDENRTEIGFQTGFNVKTQFNDFRYNKGSSTDFLGFDLSKRPLSRSFPSHLGNVTDPAELTRLTRAGFNNDWKIREKIPLPDLRLSLMIARRFETGSGRTVGNITAINYSNTYKSVEGIMNARYGVYSASADKPVYLNDYTDDQYSNDVRLGVMHNWSMVMNQANRIEFKNLLNILGSNRLTERSGTSTASGEYYQEQTEMRYSSRLTYTGQFTGTHDLRNKGALTWDAGYSYANRSEPDRRIVENRTGVNNPVSDLANSLITRYFETLHDHTVSASGDYRQPLRLGEVETSVRAGLFGEYRARDYSPREFVYKYDNVPYDKVEEYLRLPFDEMLQDQYLGADKVYVREMTRKSNAYSADVVYAAAYGAIEIPWKKLTVYAGARLENHTTMLAYDNYMGSDQKRMVSRKTQAINLLPSVNLTWKFNDRHQLRAAYGRSVNRPELRELSPAVYYDFDLFSEIGGNPDLKTALIDNLDLRYEFYPGLGETVSIGAFYKHFTNPIEWTFIDMGGTLRYRYENAEKAVSWGFELDVRKNLEFVGMRNFALVLNAAWIESNVTFRQGEVMSEPDRQMQGQSPYIVNTGLHYGSEKAGLDVAVLYNRIGKRVVGLGKSNSTNNDPNSMIPDSYEMPRNSLDISVSKKLGKRVELRASLRDILAEDVVYKQFPKFIKDGIMHEREQTTRRYNPGQSFTVGVSVKL